MDKRGGHSDYSCRGLFYSKVSLWFHFYCFVDSVVLFISSETSLHWSQRLLVGYLQCKVRLVHCKVPLYCMWKDFEASLCFGAILIALFFS